VPPRTVKTAALFLALCLTPCAALAQPPLTCDACVSNAACDEQRTSCIAECRARLFSIDPRRADCINTCSSKARLCSQSAVATCRTRNLCP
jgi:hypothetical protein